MRQAPLHPVLRCCGLRLTLTAHCTVMRRARGRERGRQRRSTADITSSVASTTPTRAFLFAKQPCRIRLYHRIPRLRPSHLVPCIPLRPAFRRNLPLLILLRIPLPTQPVFTLISIPRSNRRIRVLLTIPCRRTIPLLSHMMRAEQSRMELVAQAVALTGPSLLSLPVTARTAVAIPLHEEAVRSTARLSTYKLHP